MKKQLVAAVLAATFSGMAMAQAPAFSDVDTDGDGVISRAEARVVEGLDFDEADTDENGALDESEYQAAIEEM
jgi:hypothetical protein